MARSEMCRHLIFKCRPLSGEETLQDGGPHAWWNNLKSGDRGLQFSQFCFKDFRIWVEKVKEREGSGAGSLYPNVSLLHRGLGAMLQVCCHTVWC